MKFTATRIAALAVSTVIAASALSTAAPVSAANYAGCPNDNAMCLWAGTNGWNQANPATGRSSYVFDNNTFAGGVVGNNNDESWMNDGTQTVRVYNGQTATGGMTVCLDANGWLASSATAANKGESNRWSASIPC